MNTGERNVKGRVIYRGPRGDTYVLSNGKKLYKSTASQRPGHTRTGLINVERDGPIYIRNGFKYIIKPNGTEEYKVVYNSGRKNINQNTIFTEEVYGLKENFTRNRIGRTYHIYPMGKDVSIKYIIKLLRDNKFNFEANMIEKIELAHVYYPVKHMYKTNTEFKNKIIQSIGACHINRSNLSRINYLPAIYEQLKESSRIIRGKILFRKLSKQDFLEQFDQMIGGRPCIENLVQALTDIALGESGWRGKNTRKLLKVKNGKLNVNNFKTLKNNILAPYIGEVYKKLSNAKKVSFNEDTFWKSVKNKNVFAINQNINNIPRYAALKNIQNARVAALLAFFNYGNYLNRPNKYNVLAKAIKKVFPYGPRTKKVQRKPRWYNWKRYLRR